jgi:hypothetical protein
MPGPVPSVSTKTRGYIQPPAFHTERNHLFNASPTPVSFASDQFLFPSSNNTTNRNRSMSNAGYQQMTSQSNTYGVSSQQPSWKQPVNNEADIYVPSYQKKVHANPSIHKPMSNNQRTQQQQQQYIIETRPRPQQQPYRPASTQPSNLVHRQFNSPMSLYSNDNVQEVMKNHVSHISRVR